MEKKLPLRDMAPAGFGEVLRNQNFLRLWAGQVFSQLADKVLLILMIALVSTGLRDQDNINKITSAIYFAFTIPAILFGSVAGVFVDRWSKRAVLAGSNLLRGGLVLLIPLLPRELNLLLVITFLVSTLTQFFAPAETTTIPLILERRCLLSANSLFTTTMFGSLILGLALGEPLLAWVGVERGNWLVGGAYLVAGLILLGVGTGEDHAKRVSSDLNILKDLKEGLAYLRVNPPVRAALIQLVCLFSIFAALSIFAVGLTRVVGLKNEQFGLLLAMAGGGMAVGAWGLGQFGGRFTRAQLAFWGSVAVAVVLALLALVQNLYLVLSLCALLGVGAAMVGIPMQTVIQEETPPELRGKVFGLQNNAVNIALSFPLLLAGIAADTFGLQPVILATALMAFISAFILRRSNRIVTL
ncbi:MFS transporter [Anthocerotibacter panamensis]|uniref:MFS transporter n=1 Tax=Anthocerotibacter panamensis TaxID=2857077 RepID=UPI001C4015BA|nr:MFS transporter [Anthocerotibacter panamensis]